MAMVGTSMRSRPDTGTARDTEVEAIARALREGGAMSRHELARRVNARRWGPGRFNGAVADALAEGSVRRLGRDRVGPPT